MSISIKCRIVSPKEGKRLPGTSKDWQIYQNIFGNGPLTDSDWNKLHAMDLANGHAYTDNLWKALAEEVNDLPSGGELEVYGEY